MAIWHKNYPTGVPETVDTQKYSSIVDFFQSSVKKHPSSKAFANLGVELSYELVDQLSDQMASYLQNNCQLKPGDSIALQMPNLLQYPIALFGSLKAGLVVVNTNPLYTEREMTHQFSDSGVKAVVLLDHFAFRLENILDEIPIEHIIITSVGDLCPRIQRFLINNFIKYVKKMVPPFHLPQACPFVDALEKGKETGATPVSLDLKDTAFLQYTGGTTGVPKAALLSHGNVLANMAQISAWINPIFKTQKEVAIIPLPLYHIFSLTVSLAFTSFGCLNVLVTNPRDISSFIKTLKKYPFTTLAGVNTLFRALMEHPGFKDVDFSHLKASVAGAMALQSSVSKRWTTLTQTPLLEGYGVTESSPVLCCNPVDGTDRLGTIGLPLPSTDIKILDESGKEVPLGEVGELCAKGPQVMQGYWGHPEETQRVLKNGWLHTGDMALMDDQGFFKIVDRKKDMILVSGFNVYPNEVEEVLSQHPCVLEVAAVGVPDENSGEAVKIFVVQRSPVTSKELRNFAKEKLTAYKVPRFVEFVSSLPKSNVGKVLRRELRSTKS